MRCIDCGHENTAENPTYCAACGAMFSEEVGGRDSTSNVPEVASGSSRYLSRLAVVHGLHAAFFLFVATVMWNPSPQLQSEMGSAGTTQVYYTIYPMWLILVVGGIATLFAIVCVGTWAGNRVLWGIGVLFNTVILLFALVPPPTWFVLPTLVLGLYYGYKSYGSWREQSTGSASAELG